MACDSRNSLRSAMNPNVLNSITAIKNAINKKMIDIKRGYSDQAVESKRLLQSVSDPLSELLDLNKNKPQNSEPAPPIFDDFKKYQHWMETDDDERKDHQVDYSQMIDDALNSPSKLDRVYGPHRASGEIRLGDTPFHVINNRQLRFGDFDFPITNGLMSLLLLKSPKDYNDDDLERYRQILKITKRHLNKTGELKQHKSKKYDSIISRIFEKKGEGCDYVYFDDYNEIVERLRLLIASQQAGNNSHGNEIVSIISELREKKIIY